MALDGLEAVLESHFGKKTKASYKTKVNYVRYADDFIITGISKELLEDKALPIVEAFMAKRGLQLSAEKTLIMHIDNGFDFLGQNLRKYNGKMLIKPSSKKRKVIFAQHTDFLNCNKTVPASVVITKLNPMIRGVTITVGSVQVRHSSILITGSGKCCGSGVVEYTKIVANAGLRTSTLKQ